MSIEANRASYPLYRDGEWFASAVGHYRSFMALSKEDAEDLGVDARNPAIEAGVLLGRRLGGGYVTRLSLLQDVSATHEGQELDWQLFRHDDIGEVRLLTALGVQFQSSDLTDYYFSTDSYSPDSSYSAELELIASWSQGRVGYFVGTRSYLFSEEVSDSPIVDRPELIQLFAGVGYQF